MESAVSDKGQVTIPKPSRDRLGLVEGARLIFREEAGKLVAEKVSHVDPVTAVRGVMRDAGVSSSDMFVEELRGTPKLP